ncbi:hypothetical protein GCM10012275_64780 [Longimycelium tulufanense]|uniref:Uncharacterized protein n=1 Tax=Longimycelium tulufanense TaxID=907463 RepID=A0A8J3FZY2_9PSEU|nr:hypothetical protein GCM10012275_64780 [Longimycelium tulufanense]
MKEGGNDRAKAGAARRPKAAAPAPAVDCSPAALWLLDRLPWEKNRHGVSLTPEVQARVGAEIDRLLAAGRAEAELERCLTAAIRRCESQRGAANYLSGALADLPLPVRAEQAPLVEQGQEQVPVASPPAGPAMPTWCGTCDPRGEDIPDKRIVRDRQTGEWEPCTCHPDPEGYRERRDRVSARTREVMARRRPVPQPGLAQPVPPPVTEREVDRSAALAALSEHLSDPAAPTDDEERSA